MRLGHNQLGSTVFELLKEVVGLEDLSLEDNGIQSIGSDIGILAALQHLNLEGNSIKLIPPEFRALQQLVILNLARNNIADLEALTTLR